MVWPKTVRRMIGATALVSALAHPAVSAEIVAKGPVMLLQPEAVIGQRIESVDAMAAYIRTIYAAVARRLSTIAGPPSAGSLFIAVHPGRRAHAWVGFDPTLPPDIAQAITAAANAVPAMAVKGGTVVFALNMGLWGAAAPTQSSGPLPDAWKAVAGKSGARDPAALADRAWAAEGPKRAP